MLVVPNFDPVAIQLGPLSIHWYGLAYLAGFVCAIMLGRIKARQQHSPIPRTVVLDLILYCSIGAILGGRLGYAVFYQINSFAVDPLAILRLWEGGMSFHGGILGAFAGTWLFARKFSIPTLRLGDFLSPLCAVGFLLGRIANFINQELWGRPTEVPWSVVFPADPLLLPRHPSQLYEAALEGVVLFLVVWIYSIKPRPIGAVSGLLLAAYGVFRIFVEFFREPDAHYGFLIGNWVTMGQLLSLPLVVIGLWLLTRNVRRSDHAW